MATTQLENQPLRVSSRPSAGFSATEAERQRAKNHRAPCLMENSKVLFEGQFEGSKRSFVIRTIPVECDGKTFMGMIEGRFKQPFLTLSELEELKDMSRDYWRFPHNTRWNKLLFSVPFGKSDAKKMAEFKPCEMDKLVIEVYELGLLLIGQGRVAGTVFCCEPVSTEDHPSPMVSDV